MSEVTITIRNLLKVGYSLGLNNYPIHDENYRPILNRAIVQYFNDYEIGFNMPEIFIEKLNEKMSLIMPKYVEMYKARDIEFNPLNNVELKETYVHSLTSSTKDNTKTTDNSSSKSNSSIGKYPDSEFLEGDFSSGNFLSDGSFGNETTTNTVKNEGNGSNNLEERYTRTSSGSSAGLPLSKAMIQYEQYTRKYFNIEMLIIKELKCLFILSWSLY